MRDYLHYFDRFFEAQDAMVVAIRDEVQELLRNESNPWRALSLMWDADALADSRPLTFDQFVTVQADIDALAGTPQGAVLAVMLRNGQIGVNDRFGDWGFSVTSHGLAFMTLRSATISSGSLRGSNAFEINILFHEASHLIYPALGEDQIRFLACQAVWAAWTPRNRPWCF